ncbi:MAG: zf-HC2 domain-containing protein [Phycisphaerales bacterium]|nr:zf-HC2 domain-containing protein [Phycisphaerales bacterium]
MEHVSNRLSAYLDEQLPHDLRAQVETHLSQCSDCRNELAALRKTSIAVRQLPLPVPSNSLLNRLHASIEIAARRAVVAGGGVERFIGLLSGVAACLAIVGGLLLMQPRATASVSVPAAAWERDAVQLADEAVDNTPETAIGQWMVASLSVQGEGVSQ